jgi:hypothetical protein
VVSGGFALEDMTVRAITGVTVWEVRPNLVAGNIVLNQAYGFGQGMRGFQPYTGATVSPSSPVLIDNGSTGNSIFFVTNIADAGIGGPGGVSGFVLVGLSAQANGAEVENVFFETGVTSLAVLGPLAWTDQGWKAGSTSGTSLFFGTADVESGGTNVGLGLQAGASVYSVNTNAQFTARSTDAANNVNARYEPGVSGFFCGPVVSENRDGVSVYMVGRVTVSSLKTGNSIFCYDGAAIDRNVDPGAGGGLGWVVGPHQNSVGNSGSSSFILATPALGRGTYSGSNIYSGNSLFVVDNDGGVSVYDKRNGTFQRGCEKEKKK